jgi:hypothetical protein
VDKVGNIHGDLWSEVRNRHSRRLYLILTQPDLGSDYWVTQIFSLVRKKALFGLFTFTAMDFNRPPRHVQAQEYRRCCSTPCTDKRYCGAGKGG